MASYAPAVARIRSLVDPAATRQYSPNTINGSATMIRSYALTIAAMDGDDWLVKTDADNSVTTNRHIRACHMAIAALPDYVNVGDEQITGERFTRYQPQS